MKRVCFYHAGCPDGFGAAFAAWNAWGDAGRYVPIGHDDPIALDEVEGACVAFVDISAPNDVLLALGEVTDHLVVLDHHVTSMERYQSVPSVVNAMEERGHEIHFDLSHSGAVLAWHYFMGDDPVPDLLLYVEDQDLWNWKLDRSKQVNAAVSSFPMRFDVWNELAARSIDELARDGEPIVRAKHAEVLRALHHAHPLTIDERVVQAVNATSERSSIGHELAQSASVESWGCVYRIEGDTVLATLYSIGEFDVSAIAARYGGGGHRNAAGFSVPLERWLAEFV